jgi:hypothetical protein
LALLASRGVTSTSLVISNYASSHGSSGNFHRRSKSQCDRLHGWPLPAVFFLSRPRHQRSKGTWSLEKGVGRRVLVLIRLSLRALLSLRSRSVPNTSLAFTGSYSRSRPVRPRRLPSPASARLVRNNLRALSGVRKMSNFTVDDNDTVKIEYSTAWITYVNGTGAVDATRCVDSPLATTAAQRRRFPPSQMVRWHVSFVQHGTGKGVE